MEVALAAIDGLVMIGTRRMRAQAITDTFDDIEPIFNRRRRHSTLGSASLRQPLNDRSSSQHKKEMEGKCPRLGER